MRQVAAFLLASSLLAIGAAAQAMPGLPTAAAPRPAPAITRVEYFCSPGYEPTYGGRCVATLSRDQVELYLNDVYDDTTVVHRRHRHRHGLHERF